MIVLLLHVTQLTGFKIESIHFCMVEGSYKLVIKLHCVLRSEQLDTESRI